MSRRLISIVLVVAAGVSFGGLGQFLHDHEERAGVAHHEGINSSNWPETHDPEHCAVCHLLSAARIDRVVGPTICVPLLDPPEKSRARDDSTPCRLHVPTPMDARGPPRAHFA